MRGDWFTDGRHHEAPFDRFDRLRTGKAPFDWLRAGRICEGLLMTLNPGRNAELGLGPGIVIRVFRRSQGREERR